MTLLLVIIGVFTFEAIYVAIVAHYCDVDEWDEMDGREGLKRANASAQ
jgi:hypothetical protein